MDSDNTVKWMDEDTMLIYSETSLGQTYRYVVDIHENGDAELSDKVKVSFPSGIKNTTEVDAEWTDAARETVRGQGYTPIET